ncbi:unnamed protein product [Spirodela intermedia]|uniref:Uncharacterized protein n=1 Tax=Spirodela intermedia TaxID=51605 RepID=A0A7I8JDD6_SPIIN|nr:unnamed protein product [Spirodela intermedia]CAA6668160.1 unnamed protein product [Spirodela intermedia]
MLGDCTDFGCAVSDSGGTAKDSADGSAESPQLKRRRMLHCNHDDPVEIICAGPSSEFLNPKRNSGTAEQRNSGDILGALGESSKCWLESCFNESEMRISSDETYDLILMIEIVRALVIMSNTPWRPSYTKFPTTTASTVAYPFTLIKPCGDRGEVTLEEINQILCTKIRTEGGKRTKG